MDEGGSVTAREPERVEDADAHNALPSSRAARAALDRARVRTIYGTGLLIVFLVVWATVTRVSIDPATFLTLIAFELSLFGIGPIIKLPGS